MRYLTPELQRVFSEESQMAFVAGPRQVGKTTLARHLLEKAGGGDFYFNWDVESHRKRILKDPENFWQGARPRGAQKRQRIALDEIHKFPRWKRFLKGLYDLKKGELEILVTGSGRLDVYQRGGDSLAGRYSLYHLHPFSLGEFLNPNPEPLTPPKEFWRLLSERQTLKTAEEALQDLEMLTGFPEPLFSGSESRLRRWRRSHQRLIVREDLRDLTRIREIGLIETLITLLPERIGSPISVNALREDLGVNFLTVQGWLGSLERLYYIFKIRPYAGRLARTLRREEKVYFYDFSTVENPGARFENLTALHLRKLCDAWSEWGYGDFELHYVRDREKREVDFLIVENRRPYALIEAKLSAEEIDPSLRYFYERLKPLYAVQVVREPKRFKHVFRSGNILYAPAACFLGLI